MRDVINVAELAEKTADGFAVAKDDGVQQTLTTEIADGNRAIRRRLFMENPFNEKLSVLEKAEVQLKDGIHDINSIAGDFAHFREIVIADEMPYWKNKIAELKKQKKEAITVKPKRSKIPYQEPEEKILRSRLQKQWRKQLDMKITKWKFYFIAAERNRLLKKLREWLELLQKLADTLADLDFEPGLFLDWSKGNITVGDVEELKRWAEYIKRDSGVKNLCDMMGRLRVAERQLRRELANTLVVTTESLPDFNSKEEIVGVRLGNDVQYALPQEKALLADADTEILFDIKFVENRLMCFDMQGIMTADEEMEERMLVNVDGKEKLGPVIICVDTSGSMHGAPETIAKAVTLYMASRAASQQRDCMLINFSTGIETMDLSGSIGIGAVIKFLRRSFQGGTDVAPALNYALEKMQEEKYEKSDLLIVSDFVMGNLPEETTAKITAAKKTGNKFYSLCIGQEWLSGRLKIFDKEWIYNPSSGKIQNLHRMLYARI